ncbi:MAG: CDP-diacylglycerol--serine O-phosphatidyltransferase [Synergistaceae bacterium]|jgi:CDP-diacylglycerol--serine O-phosphatidyltransferase|nr:CDP-diacylglycerol--serine O-phosphatidyltransferase [Synergistaceae bacterium]
MNFLRVKQGRKKRKPLSFKQIAPNMVTSGNLLCGMFSLMLVFNGRFIPAAWLVFFAVIFDGLDGKVARSLGGGSQFGLEYDSLADLVSFGVAPAMMIYVVSLRELGGVLGAMAACFFALCVALRLARFNVVHVPGPFQGLPSPAGGLFAASFVLAKEPLFPAMMAVVLVFTGLLMVSSVPYANLKKLNRESADRKKCFFALGFVSLCFLLLRGTAPLVLFSVYIVSGLLRFDWGEWLLLQTDEPVEERLR